MKRINTATAVNGMFVDGNRTLGKKATQFSAEWCNAVQEELCAIVESITGEAVTGESNHEVIDALNGSRVFTSIAVGSAVLRTVEGTGTTMGGLAALVAGTIEATAKLKVGGAELVPGNGQPSLAGLYALSAGNIEATNIKTDTIDVKTDNASSIEVKKKLVGDSNAQTQALELGATKAESLVVDGDAEVAGDLTVDGDLLIVGTFVADGGFATNNGDFSTSNGSVSAPNGTVTAGKLKLGSSGVLVAVNDGDEATITNALKAMASGTVAVIINKNSSNHDLQFEGTFYPVGLWQIPVGGAATVIVHGEGDDKKCYPMVPEFPVGN